MLRAPLRGEGDPLPVGRPGRERLVLVAGGQKLRLPSLQLEEVQVVAAPQEADPVLLEVEAVDDDRLRPPVLAPLPLRGLGIRVACDQGKSLPVGRPDEVGDAASEVGQPHRLAATPVEQPDLVRVVLVAPAREEGEGAVVGAPAGRVLALRARGEPQGLRPIPAGHPDVGVPAVLGSVRGRDRVGDPAAVGRHLGVRHRAEPEEIVEGEEPPLALRQGGGSGGSGEEPQSRGQRGRPRHQPVPIHRPTP